jgi:hypothetical protein
MSIDDGLRALFHRHLPHPRDLQNVELGLTGAGVPDLNFCVEGAEGFVEMKATRRWSVDLKPEQIGWIVTRCRHGGRVLIAVRRRAAGGPRTESADELFLFRGVYARELRAGGIRWALDYDVPASSSAPRRGSLAPHPLLGQWTGGPKRWSWDEVRWLMMS